METLHAKSIENVIYQEEVIKEYEICDAISFEWKRDKDEMLFYNLDMLAHYLRIELPNPDWKIIKV